jgi:hypothetical protein
MARSPLFDLFDPYGMARRGGGSMDPIGVAPLDGDPRVEDLMSEEEQASMLQSLAYAGSSGLSGFGWLLDTPGAMVRGGLSGGPLKAISALWESSDDRVTGRELARQYGLAGDQDNWANFGGGLATEVLLDPLTYASLGLAPLLGGVAKTAAGKAAQKAAMFSGDLGLVAKQAVDRGLRPAGYGRMMLQRETPEAYLDLLKQLDPARAAELSRNFDTVAGDMATQLRGQRMSASNRLSIPMLYDGATDLWGEGFGDWITKQSDALGQVAQQTPGLGAALRGARGLFWSPTRGQTTEAGQWMARRESESRRLGERDAGRFLGPVMAETARRVGMDRWQNTEFKRQFDDAFGLAMENQVGTEPWRALPEEIRNLFDGGGGSYLVDEARAFQEAKIQRARSLGLPLAEADLPFEIGFLSRQRTYPGSPRMADGYAEPVSRNLDTGTELFGMTGEASRRDWTRPFPRWVLNKMAKDKGFQDGLRGFKDNESLVAVQDYVDEWLRSEAPEYWARTERDNLAGPFSYLRKDLEEGSEEATQALAKESGLYGELADSIASLPLNYAEEGLPYYGDSLTDFINYAQARGRTERVGPALIDELAKAALRSPRTPSFSSYTAREALEKLGFNLTAGQKLDDAGNVIERGKAESLLAKAIGANANVATADRKLAVADYAADLDTLRVPQDLIENLKAGVQRATTPTEAKGLLKKYDQFLQSFKSLALLFPSRYTRDAYSGSSAAATQGLFNLRDSYAGLQAGRGNYKPLARRLRQAPGYDNLTDEQAVRKFLGSAGAEQLTEFNIADDLGREASRLTTPDVFPGSAGPYMQGVGAKMDPRTRDFYNVFANRRRSGNPNWLLDAGDRAATASDSWNRIGTYLTAIRQGYTPEAAKQAADLTQVVYRPEAFSSFERDVIKRLVPFYSYTKGIAPLVADNLINQPAGLMGQSIRFVNRAGEPSEDRFVPEYLRQSAAIPLDGSFPLLGLDTPGITRFLTNIDLPHEGLLNLFTPGLGNTLTQKLTNTLMKTGQNILGQTSPALKGPLELFTDRQFYSGRQLSDLYSMAEKYGIPGGRIWDQIGSNLPGGSRAMGLFRQFTDDRISLPERLAKIGFNTLTGLKLQDVDQDRTVRLAARSALNELLTQTPNIGTYENLFIKNEDLMKLSPQEQRQYLLYRVLQSRAAREARERKKAAADPMQMLGLG